ncbi:YybH family protein [Aestuariivivens sediminis]|uniref:YybH family protein n=1 Tax=Aestuariivivens sediminis TaxID=2913557 RepID=UPI001F5AB91F|nr:nuclear transport factor 2 family protein [Aestuariivivens sediminis]
MKTTQLTKAIFLTVLIAGLFLSSCNGKDTEKGMASNPADLSVLEKEIAQRLREFENHLRNGDSIALGNMYLADAVIMPSLTGKDAIVKNFGSMIRDSITGSSFNTIGLWGDDQLLVEEGTGVWSHENGQVVGKGTYLVVWKKENGNWMILRDSWFPERKQ